MEVIFQMVNPEDLVVVLTEDIIQAQVEQEIHLLQLLLKVILVVMPLHLIHTAVALAVVLVELVIQIQDQQLVEQAVLQ